MNLSEYRVGKQLILSEKALKEVIEVGTIVQVLKDDNYLNGVVLLFEEFFYKLEFVVDEHKQVYFKKHDSTNMKFEDGTTILTVVHIKPGEYAAWLALLRETILK